MNVVYIIIFILIVAFIFFIYRNHKHKWEFNTVSGFRRIIGTPEFPVTVYTQFYFKYCPSCGAYEIEIGRHLTLVGKLKTIRNQQDPIQVLQLLETTYNRRLLQRLQDVKQLLESMQN